MKTVKRPKLHQHQTPWHEDEKPPRINAMLKKYPGAIGRKVVWAVAKDEMRVHEVAKGLGIWQDNYMRKGPTVKLGREK